MQQTLTQYQRINLNPGELHIADNPAIVWTVLGSCVAIILHHRHAHIGAIAHAQLAEERHADHRCSDACPHPCYMLAPDSNRFKFVTCSFRYMLEDFLRRGMAARDIDVKVFGGSNMFPTYHKVKSVGDENLEVLRKLIQDHGLRIVSEHVGGTAGRILYFYSDTGEVWLKINTSQRHL